MRILISNDDGVSAPGIKVLSDSMQQLGDMEVIAPDRNRSGASNSLTLLRPCVCGVWIISIIAWMVRRRIACIWH